MSSPQQPTTGSTDSNAQSANAPSTSPSGTNMGTNTGTNMASDMPTTNRDSSRGSTQSPSAATTRRSEGGERQSRSRSRGPALSRWSLPPSPWELLRRMSDDMNRAAEDFRGGRMSDTSRPQRSSSGVIATNSSASPMAQMEPMAWVPDVEVVRQPNDLVVLVDLPGIAPDEIDISINDGLLTIAGERMMEQRDEQDGFVRTERSYGSFMRTVILPDGADESRIQAKIDNGVLEIDVPLAGDSHARRIPVKS
jgi:HSP20 family protein